jgi:hypothetical protein
MNEYKQEFFPRPDDSMHDRCYWRRVGFGLFIAIALAVIFAPLYGCATEKKPDPQVCYLKLLGNTEEGFSVVLQQCVTPEEFRAAQK